MTDEGGPAVVRFHFSRGKPRELSCLGEGGKFLPPPETVDPSMEGGATAGPKAVGLYRPPSVWMANVELSVLMIDPVPLLWLEWGKLSSEEGMRKEGCPRAQA